jgi:hypothetical protein
MYINDPSIKLLSPCPAPTTTKRERIKKRKPRIKDSILCPSAKFPGARDFPADLFPAL